MPSNVTLHTSRNHIHIYKTHQNILIHIHRYKSNTFFFEVFDINTHICLHLPLEHKKVSAWEWTLQYSFTYLCTTTTSYYCIYILHIKMYVNTEEVFFFLPQCLIHIFLNVCLKNGLFREESTEE